jgi:hypothetical protein
MTNETESLQAVAVRKALRILDAAGAVYAVQHEGETYGTLAVKEPPTYAARYPRGATRAHYTPIIQHMKPGDSVEIPFGRFDPKVLSSNLAAAVCRDWGAGSFTARRNDAKSVIELLRLF